MGSSNSRSIALGSLAMTGSRSLMGSSNPATISRCAWRCGLAIPHGEFEPSRYRRHSVWRFLAIPHGEFEQRLYLHVRQEYRTRDPSWGVRTRLVSSPISAHPYISRSLMGSSNWARAKPCCNWRDLAIPHGEFERGGGVGEDGDQDTRDPSWGVRTKSTAS